MEAVRSLRCQRDLGSFPGHQDQAVHLHIAPIADSRAQQLSSLPCSYPENTLSIPQQKRPEAEQCHLRGRAQGKHTRGWQER